jgi:enterochelin esterase-like enzyme
MRWLVIACVACSSPSPSRPVAPRSEPVPVAAPPPARPRADAIAPGKAVDRELTVPEVHRYRVTVAANTVITGVVEQDGIDLELITYDATGEKLRTFDSPNGEHGPEPFVIEAKVAGDYDLEIRRVVLPPNEPDADLSKHGKYHATVAVMTADDYAYTLAQKHIASPRILAAWREVRLHHQEAADKVWAELAGKSPIVEAYPGHPEDRLVTFVFRSKRTYVGAVGILDFREQPLVRLGDSDLWYVSARMPADSVVEYAFVVADAPPELTTVFHPDGVDPRVSNLELDPNNPAKHLVFSRFEGPAVQPQPWIAPNPNTPKGTIKELSIDSTQLKEKRRVGVYLPAGYDPKQRYPLLVVFDGEAYGLAQQPQIATPTILDNMIAAKKIPPIVAAFVANQGIRRRDLSYHEPFARFIVQEVVPKLRSAYHAGLRPDDVIVAGSSLGGLTSTFVAFHHPDVIGKVLSQSGAYHINPDRDQDIAPNVEGNQLTREIAAAPRKPLTFYVETGLFEGVLLASNRHLRDVLVAKGYALTYREFHGGHDYWVWRGTISDGLMALLTKR